MAIQELSYTGGLNLKADHANLPPGQALAFSDWFLDYGTCRGRFNPIVLNTVTFNSGAGVLASSGWVDSTATYSRLFAITSGAKAYRSNAVYVPGTALAFTDITNSVTQPTGPITWAVLNGILVYAGLGAVNQITSFAANSAALSTGAQTGSIVRTVNNMMFLAGSTTTYANSTTGSTISWSNVSDPTTWSAANSLDFRKNDGDWITALGEFGTELIIFKRNSIGLLQTTTQSIAGITTLGPLSTFATGVGCFSPTCVDNLSDGRCAFLGSDFQVYLFDGTILQSLTRLPPPFPSVMNAGIFNTISPANPPVAGLKYDERSNEINVYLTAANGTTTYWFCYDLLQKYWRQVTGFSVLSMGKMLTGSSQTSYQDGTPLLVGDNQGFLWQASYLSGSTVDQTGTAVLSNLTLSTLMPENFINAGVFSLTILITGTLTLQYGFDNTISANTFTLQSPSLDTIFRKDLKIPVVMGTGGLRPSTFQVKLIGNAAGSGSTHTRIYKIFMSDVVNS
jgi:hypothetical protein